MSAVHACSSESSTEDKKNNGGTGGDAGEGGAPSNGGASGSAGTGTGGVSGTDTGGSGGISGAAGAGDAAGQAGEATGGVSGSAGAGAGGQGGEGAVGPGAACTMCMEGSATALQANCGTSPDCAAWLECVQGCSDAECLDACDRATPQVAPYQYAIYEALCDACATDCAALELCDRDCVDNVNLVPTATPPATLAGTGLYETPTATPDQVAPYARPFHPEYELWSDGAQKRRWAYIPRCSRIGTAGINRWQFPVGTRMWKEFTIPAASTGNTPVRVETRFIHKYGAGESDWVFASYQWPADNSTVPTAQSATLAPDTGVMNANGTMHDIPARGQCVQCHHQTLPDKVLGFSAIQLSHMEGGVTIRELADNGWLTDPFAPGMDGALARNGYDPPGDEATQRALGYFHANCGNCHNIGTTHGENPMANVPAARLQLMIGSLGSLQETYVYTTLFDQPTTRPAFSGCDRIEPGNSAQSEVILRMSRRDIQQMPPIGTEQVHAAAITNLRAWIDAMPTTGTSTCVPPP